MDGGDYSKSGSLIVPGKGTDPSGVFGDRLGTAPLVWWTRPGKG